MKSNMARRVCVIGWIVCSTAVAGGAFAQDAGPCGVDADGGACERSDVEERPGTPPNQTADAGADSDAGTGSGTDSAADAVAAPDTDSEYEDTVVEYGATEEEDPDGGVPLGVEAGPDGSVATVQTDEIVLEPGADEKTGVEGRVVSRRPKKPLPDAPVTAKGKADGKVRSAITDEKGRYKLYLPPGRYTLRSYYDLYHGARWDNIVVRRGRFKKVNFVLDPITKRDAGIEELEVAYLADTSSEAAQLNIRKEAVAVQDAISAQEISRSGDSSASGAVKRVVGVTVDEDKRLVIRGLGGRYSRALMNGMSLPGVDPDKPGVPLDIFPTSAMSSLGVIKTGRSDLPGDFAGGLLSMETLLFPDDFTFKVGGSVKYNTLSTFKNRPTYDTPRSDWLTRNSGRRALPGEIKQGRLIESQFDRARTFNDSWNVFDTRSGPGFGLSATLGDQFKFKNKHRGGYMLRVSYGTEQRLETGRRKIGEVINDGDGRINATIGDLRKGVFSAGINAFGTASVELDRKNVLSYVGLFSRSFEDKTERLDGFDREIGNFGERTRFTAATRQILFNQIRGDHQELTKRGLRLTWSGFGSLASRLEPNERSYRYIIDDNDRFRWRPNATLVSYDLTQRDFGGAGQFRLPLWQQAYGTVGARARAAKRDFETRRFAWQQGLQANNPQLVGDPDDLFGDEGIGTLSQVRETTNGVGPDAYDGKQQLYAAFATVETPLGHERFKLLTGVRMEAFLQQVQGFNPIDPSQVADPDDNVDRSDLDFLPAVNLSYELKEDMFLRAAYSMTVARPVFREIAPFTFVDTTRDRVIQGNPDLKRSRVQNVDLRWERFFGDGNLVAASAFYKHFKDPIETVSNAAGDARPQNVKQARLVGGEVEARIGLGGHFSTAGNATVTYSRVQLNEEQANVQASSRPLAFQSPFVINLSLTYDNPDAGFKATIAYNTFGKRLVEVATVGTAGFLPPNIEELPFHALNLNASYSPSEHWAVKLKATNLAFQPRRLKQGNLLVERRKIGGSISLGAEYQY